MLGGVGRQPRALEGVGRRPIVDRLLGGLRNSVHIPITTNAVVELIRIEVELVDQTSLKESDLAGGERLLDVTLEGTKLHPEDGVECVDPIGVAKRLLGDTDDLDPENIVGLRMHLDRVTQSDLALNDEMRLGPRDPTSHLIGQDAGRQAVDQRVPFEGRDGGTVGGRRVEAATTRSASQGASKPMRRVVHDREYPSCRSREREREARRLPFPAP